MTRARGEQMLESFAVALVDVGTCLQREPIEEGDQLLRVLELPVDDREEEGGRRPAGEI